LKTLLRSLSVLSVELVPIHQRLVHIRRQLGALAAQLKHEKKELKPLVEELRKIDSSRVDGKFLGPGGTSVPAGQAILVGLLEECFEIIQDIRAREGAENISPPLKPIWERLTEMRAKLERLRKCLATIFSYGCLESHVAIISNQNLLIDGHCERLICTSESLGTLSVRLILTWYRRLIATRRLCVRSTGCEWTVASLTAKGTRLAISCCGALRCWTDQT